jgi:hypothetical protein
LLAGEAELSRLLDAVERRAKLLILLTEVAPGSLALDWS